jgi:hypothetical protein
MALVQSFVYATPYPAVYATANPAHL